MKRILIIEDDLNIAELERDYLQLNGFKADIVRDGAQGLSRALTGKYDLVIVDLMLPGKDGYAIIKEIRKRLDVTLVVVSAKSEDISKIRGLEYGADDYLTKPFSPGNWWPGSSPISKDMNGSRAALRLANRSPAGGWKSIPRPIK